MPTYNDVRVSAEETIAAVKCPRCGKPKGNPCVYVEPRNPPEELRNWAGYQLQRERAGKPTKKPHLERFQEARETRWQSLRKRRAYPVRPADPELVAASRAMHTQDLREQLALAIWLRTWGSALFRKEKA